MSLFDNPNVMIGWVDDWEVRDKKKCHPSSAIQVVPVKDVREAVKELMRIIDKLPLNEELIVLRIISEVFGFEEEQK